MKPAQSMGQKSELTSRMMTNRSASSFGQTKRGTARKRVRLLVRGPA
jgi:hypothetical protein